MVKSRAEPLDAVFSALADPTRRGILAALAAGGSPVSALAQPFDMSLPGFMKHLRILEDAGLLEREKEGRVVNCMLTADPMREAMKWLERYRKFWDERLDALARYLENEGAGPLPQKARGALPDPPRPMKNGGPGPLPLRPRGALPDPPHPPYRKKEKKTWPLSRKSPRSRSSASSKPPRKKSGVRSRSRKR